jgi:hypothetical protein
LITARIALGEGEVTDSTSIALQISPFEACGMLRRGFDGLQGVEEPPVAPVSWRYPLDPGQALRYFQPNRPLSGFQTAGPQR